MITSWRHEKRTSLDVGLAVQLFVDLKCILAPGTFWQVVRRMFASGAMNFAVQMAYFLLLFLFPFFIVLIHLASFAVNNPVAITQSLIAEARGYLPPSMINLLKDYLSGAMRGTSLSIFAFSSLFTFAAGLSAVQQIIRAADNAYGVEETRPLWKRLGIATLAVLGFVLLVATLLFVILSPRVWAYLQQTIGLSGIAAQAWGFLRWVIAFVALTLAFAVLYQVAPNANLPFRWVTAGGLMTTTFLIIASKIFELWATELFRPTQLYGQLGGGIVLLLWLFGIGLVIRFGIEINAQLLRMNEEKGT